ncbi:type IV secretory system conjugative DNA transfer family protein [Vibrio sp. Hal054]|uniref:type IV secretory system conjugative DNA transfer family protein n=1 Tax=Vibrio sp. Hal054 TaxID=3035158 RepID=UPI00301D412B
MMKRLNQIVLSMIIGSIGVVPNVAFCAKGEGQLLTKEALLELNESNAEYIKQQSERKEFRARMLIAAKEYGYNHGYMTEYNYMKKRMLAQKQYWDRFLDFRSLSSVLATGAAKGMFLLGGVVDEADSSVKEIDEKTILTEDKKYIIKAYPRLAISPPYWQDYIFSEPNKDLRLPAKSILPESDIERDIWKEGVEIGWQRGQNAALDDFLSRIRLLYADLIGMTRYWRLVEAGIITDVKVDTVDYYLQHLKLEKGESLTFNPRLVAITSQSSFSEKPEEWDAYSSRDTDGDKRQQVRDDIILGNANLELIQSSDVTIFTPKHEQLMNEIKQERLKRYE